MAAHLAGAFGDTNDSGALALEDLPDVAPALRVDRRRHTWPAPSATQITAWPLRSRTCLTYESTPCSPFKSNATSGIRQTSTMPDARLACSHGPRCGLAAEEACACVGGSAEQQGEHSVGTGRCGEARGVQEK